MKWLDNIIALWSPIMRSTLELGRLNRLWEDFNDKKITSEETQMALLKNRWKYHTKKAKLLLDFTLLK